MRFQAAACCFARASLAVTMLLYGLTLVKKLRTNKIMTISDRLTMVTTLRTTSHTFVLSRSAQTVTMVNLRMGSWGVIPPIRLRIGLDWNLYCLKERISQFSVLDRLHFTPIFNSVSTVCRIFSGQPSSPIGFMASLAAFWSRRNQFVLCLFRTWNSAKLWENIINQRGGMAGLNFFLNSVFKL